MTSKRRSHGLVSTLTIASCIAIIRPTVVLGALGVLQPTVLEELTLEVRRFIVQPALEGKGASKAPAGTWKLGTVDDLEDVRRYAPAIRDNSMCSSSDGPYCGLLGRSPPVITDGARFQDVHFSLFVEESPKVSCGGHEAATCAQCGKSEEWCKGDCMWTNQGTCVLKNSPETSTVNCGGHKAATCAQCPQGKGKAWCNGDCEWTIEGTCVPKNSPEPSAGRERSHTPFR